MGKKLVIKKRKQRRSYGYVYGDLPYEQQRSKCMFVFPRILCFPSPLTALSFCSYYSSSAPSSCSLFFSVFSLFFLFFFFLFAWRPVADVWNPKAARRLQLAGLAAGQSSFWQRLARNQGRPSGRLRLDTPGKNKNFKIFFFFFFFFWGGGWLASVCTSFSPFFL